MPSKQPSKASAQITTYDLRKASVDKRAARVLFSHGFTTSAFEAGMHLRRGDDGPSGLPKETKSWISEEGHDALAAACLGYLFALEHRVERPEDSSFVGLVRQIQQGAQTIAEAANEIARQAQRHYRESGEKDHVRESALLELGRALNGRFFEADDEQFEGPRGLRFIGNPLSGLDLEHGLSNCAKLANKAEIFLTLYNHYAEAVRSADRKGRSRAGTVARGAALPMKSGRRADEDRDAFLADLAKIYLRGLSRVPSANLGTGTTGGRPSPFMRFVARVFGELSQPFPSDHRLNVPSASAVNAVMQRQEARRGTRKRKPKTGISN